jgi:hypothetical protein
VSGLTCCERQQHHADVCLLEDRQELLDVGATDVGVRLSEQPEGHLDEGFVAFSDLLAVPLLQVSTHVSFVNVPMSALMLEHDLIEFLEARDEDSFWFEDANLGHD